jgi:hypothetical protein
LYWVENAGKPKSPQILVVGDSRVAEGFSSHVANAAVAQRLYFWNLGMPGTSPRIWYYALRDLDPTRRRFAAIVIALDHYPDQDGPESLDDRITDLNYLAVRLRLDDCLGFAASMHKMTYRHRALAGCLFRGTVLRADVQSFLQDPKTRMEHAEDWLENGLNYTNDYGGKPENLRGLSVDWSQGTIRFPEGVSERVRAEVRGALLPQPAPATGALSRYRRLWLGRILDLYKNSPTRVIFLQLPRAPLPRPANNVAAVFVESVSRRPHVEVLPAETFEDLERPELFADGLHLNRDGRPVFTSRLAGRVDAILADRAIAPGGGR